MFNYVKDFFERLTSTERIASAITGFLTWFGGLIFLDSALVVYAVKGAMWLIGLVFGVLIPKIVSTYYERTLKDKIFKPKKNNDADKDSNEEAA